MRKILDVILAIASVNPITLCATMMITDDIQSKEKAL
jgi:hypothetical protein